MPTKAVGEPPKVKFCNELMICTWNDACKTKSVKIVSMSTKHTGELVDTGKTHFQTRQNILKLDVIREYNATMGGVDNLSRVIDPYNIQRKGRKWYRKLAKLFIEIAVYKSFILWKKINNPNIDKLQFRQDIINSIAMFHMTKHRTHQTSRNPGASGLREPTHLVGKHHIELISCCPGEKRRREVCTRCSAIKKRTDGSYQCARCKITLCMTPCFEIYHTKKDITRSHRIDESYISESNESETEKCSCENDC